MHRFTWTTPVASLAPCLLLVGCASAPPLQPLPAWPLQLQVSYFAGQPLAGPLPDAAAPPPKVLCTLRYAVFALAAMPEGAVPLGQRVQLVAQPDTDTPLRAVIEAAAQVGTMSAAAAHTFCEQLATAAPTAARLLTEGSSVAVSGFTTTLRVTDADEPLRSDSMLVAIDGDGKVSLVFGADHHRQLELLQLPPSPVADTPFLFAWPRRSEENADAAVAVVLQFEPGTEALSEAALAQAQQQASEVRQSAAAQIETPPQLYLRQQRRQQAILALANIRARRPALLQLAQEAGAGLVADMALTGDDAMLAEVVTRIGDTAALATAETPQLALTFERAGYRALLPHLDQGDLAPAMRAVLYAHAGAAGSDSNALQLIVDRATDHAHLAQLLVQENLGFLYEDDPVRTVGAFDWLQAQRLAPPGFDPLGDRSSRRAALRAHENRTAAPGGGK